MSTSEEIHAVYEQDIAEKSKIVERKYGKLPFYAGCKDMSVYELYYGFGIENIRCCDYCPKTNKPSRRGK